jgi:hypothetical protein
MLAVSLPPAAGAGRPKPSATCEGLNYLPDTELFARCVLRAVRVLFSIFISKQAAATVTSKKTVKAAVVV